MASCPLPALRSVVDPGVLVVVHGLDGRSLQAVQRELILPYFIEIPLADGETILAEITGQVEDLAPVSSRGREVLGQLPGTLTDALNRVQAFAGEVLSRMKEYHQPPDRVSVEFGLTFSARAGIFIAESAAEGHLNVTAEWCRSVGPAQSASGDA